MSENGEFDQITATLQEEFVQTDRERELACREAIRYLVQEEVGRPIMFQKDKDKDKDKDKATSDKSWLEQPSSEFAVTENLGDDPDGYVLPIEHANKHVILLPKSGRVLLINNNNLSSTNYKLAFPNVQTPLMIPVTDDEQLVNLFGHSDDGSKNQWIRLDSARVADRKSLRDTYLPMAVNYSCIEKGPNSHQDNNRYIIQDKVVEAFLPSPK